MNSIETNSEKKLADFLKKHPPAPPAPFNEYVSILKKIENQSAFSWRNLLKKLQNRWYLPAVGFTTLALYFFVYKSLPSFSPQNETVLQQDLNESLSILSDVNIAESLTTIPDDEWLLASSEEEEL